MADLRLATIERSNGDELRVDLSEFNGRAYLHIRVWYTPKEGGERKPGKGVALRVNELAQVASALDAASSRVDRNGRIVPEQRENDPTEAW